MNSDKVRIRETLELFNRHKGSIFLIMFLSLGFSFSLAVFMKKQFKSEFEINVYSKYFQNPLISEIIPGVYNIPEMRFTIDSMVKEAINDDYLDQLALEYNMYSLEEEPEVVAKKRQYFRDHFKYYSTGGQSYKVIYEDSDPYRTKKISEKTLDRVKGHFINTRIVTIERVKSIMLERLQSLNASRKMGTSGTEKALASRSPEVLRAELTKIDANISALSKQYNMNHPKLQDLALRRRTVQAWLEEFKEDVARIGSEEVFAMPIDKETNSALAGKFYTKFHDFNMALDIEKRSLESYLGIIERPQLPTSPVWPKKRLFAILGFIFGVIFSLLYVFGKEILAPGKTELIKIEAKELNTAFLGEFYCARSHVPSIVSERGGVSRHVEPTVVTR